MSAAVLAAMCAACQRDVTEEVDWSIVWITDDNRLEYRPNAEKGDPETVEWKCPNCGGRTFEVLRSNA